MWSLEYHPEQWHDFFVTVGGGAAALTGLAVVGMSMHVQTISKDPVLLNRARMILVGLAGVFMRCSLALMGGLGEQGVAVALFTVALVVMTIGFVSYAPITRSAKAQGAALRRMIGGTTLYCLEMVGAGFLFNGFGWGLILTAIAMVANFYFAVSGSWLLLMGIGFDEERGRRQGRK
jgi:hypothetical protein